MKLKKKLGKLKFELNLTPFQVFGVIAWIFLILVLPISIDLYSKYNTTEANGSTQTQNRVAGATTDSNNPFTYTVNLDDKKELISTLTMVFGGVSAVIALVSLIILFKENKKERTGVFIN
jgi:hypothetical protein